jgi:hypothetical protein
LLLSLPIKFQHRAIQAFQHHMATRWRMQRLARLQKMIHAIAEGHPSLAASDAQAAGLLGAQTQRLRRSKQIGTAAGSQTGGAVLR